jgi:hypothetical protein
LASIFGTSQNLDVQAAAGALAKLAALAAPREFGTQRVLAEIVVAVQRHVIDHPDMPLDRAIAAETALAMGAQAAGADALRTTFEELGNDALDINVRRALHDQVFSELIRRGAVRLVGH